MNSQFNMIFSIKVFHEYFEKNICNCFVYKPTKKTCELINRYGFIIKKNSNGFDFYNSKNSNLIDYLSYIELASDHSSFEFEIETTNSNFIFFTEIPTDWIGQIQFSSSKFITTEKNIQLTATYSSQNSTASLANLKIYFQDLIALLKNKQSCNYTIHFESRTTQWRYYFINKSGINLTNAIISGKSPIQFEQATIVTIQNGKQAILFSSGKNFIKMSEIPKYKFDLIDISGLKNQSKKIVFKGLPSSSPRNLEIDEENGTKITTSPMYVYI